MAKPRPPAKKKLNKLRNKTVPSDERKVESAPFVKAFVKPVINKTVRNQPISKKYSLRPSEDKPSIFDRISQKRIDILTTFLPKEVATRIENYQRYDWFNLMAETIMINSCMPMLDNYDEKSALSLQEKVRQRLVENFNKVLSKSARSSYPLKSVINLFKRYLRVDCQEAKHAIFGDTNQFTNFHGLLYDRMDSRVNEDIVMVCSYGARLILHSALSKFNLPQVFIRGLGFHEDEGLMNISIYRILWPYGEKRSFFFLPYINDGDFTSDDDESDVD